MTVRVAPPVVDALAAGLVDYAGLFPPASLDMATAVRNYAAYRAASQRRMLGRFIVPVSRLPEFAAAAAGLLPTGRSDSPWRLAALGGTNLTNDLQEIAGPTKGVPTADLLVWSLTLWKSKLRRPLPSMASPPPCRNASRCTSKYR